MPDYNGSTGATSTSYLNNNVGDSELQSNIRLLFDKSLSSVQSYSSEIHQTYLNPAYRRARSFSEVYPILSLFISFCAAFGLVPILLFLCSSIFVISASIFSALALAIIFSASVVGFFALLLFFALFCTSLISVAAAIFVLAAYELVRLVALVRQQPTWRTGINQWAFELREFALLRFPDGSAGTQRARDSPVKVEMHDIKLE